ncbi:MAG: hypothetical protein KDA21_14260, partial [Phycisphaerales bacterium]|nr:hypothetical protein [Phycisphaerales bacterium]
MGKLCRACRGVRSWSVRLWAAAGVLVPGWSATLHAQASLPVDPDEIVVTCHSGYPPDFTGQPTYDPSRPNAYVVALFNTANPVAQGAPLGPSYVNPTTYGWFASSFHNEFQPQLNQRWTASN